MLDMGFLPDIRRVLRHIPTKRQTLFFSATMPPPIAELSREMLHDPVTINLERRSTPATGITQAVYPVPQHLKPGLLLKLLTRDEVRDALVFTRTKHRADRLAKYLEHAQSDVQRIHGNRSQAQRTQALEGFKSGSYQVLVATDIAARGIDVTALGHVINFDVPAQPEDYIHRVGRTARAEMTGSAFTLVAPEEEGDVRAIEKAINRRLPRVTVPDFDYTARAEQRLEVPHAQRIAEIRARKAEERQRARANAERRAAHRTVSAGGQGHARGTARGLAQPARARTAKALASRLAPPQKELVNGNRIRRAAASAPPRAARQSAVATSHSTGPFAPGAFVAPGLDDAAALKHVDAVRGTDRREPVRDEDRDRLAGRGDVADGLADLLFGQ